MKIAGKQGYYTVLVLLSVFLLLCKLNDRVFFGLLLLNAFAQQCLTYFVCVCVIPGYVNGKLFVNLPICIKKQSLSDETCCRVT